MKAKLSASIMCADLLHLEGDLAKLEDSGVDYIHCDVMDGHFVPNLMIGTELVRAIKERTTLPLDIHLMVDEPERMIPWFKMGENDIVSVHYESTPHLHRALSMILDSGASPALALNPTTSLTNIVDVLAEIDMLLIMTVNPGYAGQKLIEHTLSKITRARTLLNESGFSNIPIEVDGNCSFENMPRMQAHGASVFVAGSSSVFDPMLGIENGVREARKCLGQKKREW